METKTNFDYEFTPLRKEGDKLIVADESEWMSETIKTRKQLAAWILMSKEEKLVKQTIKKLVDLQPGPFRFLAALIVQESDTVFDSGRLANPSCPKCFGCLCIGAKGKW